MQLNKFLLIASVALLFAACGVKKAAVTTQPEPEPEPEIPTWHTCLIQGAKAKATTSSGSVSATVNMQAVHDSLIIVSVMPMLGIEMVRLEATPTVLVAFDKVHSRCVITSYEDLNTHITPSLSWKQLQQICSAELPNGSEKARLVYRAGKRSATIEIEYPPRKTDVPLKMTRLRTAKYKRVDINDLL